LNEQTNSEAAAGQFIADSDILDFARRWGVMGFCPQHERPGCACSSIEKLPNGFEFRERLDLWRVKILEALAMRRIGESLSSGGTGAKRDWKLLIFEERNTRDNWGQPWRNETSARRQFSTLMNRWLYVGDLRPRFGWHENHWAISATVGGGLWPLFGHLALYLALAVAGGTQSSFCYFCGRQYFPQRRPTPGQKNSCGDPECTKAYWRESKRPKKRLKE